MQTLHLDAITLDPDLQPRAQIDDETWRDYAEALAAGAAFPPVTVFLDGATYWLADGYHRWHAHNSINAPEIAATIRQGSKQDALRFSLAANAQHGKQRGQADYRKAYEIACRNGLTEPADAASVRDLLECSLRWARDLTKVAREQKERDQAAAIAAGKAAGKSTRKIAAEVGVDHSTVVRAGGAKRKTSLLHQPAPPPPAKAPPATAGKSAPSSGPVEPPPGVETKAPSEPERLPGLAAIEQPGVRQWALALEAMRAINDLPPVDEMFARPDWLQAQAVEDEVFRAAAWLNTFSTRFAHDRPAR